MDGLRAGGYGGRVTVSSGSEVIPPSGDATGVTDAENMIAAFADLAATTKGTVTLGPGPYYIDSRIIVPDSVNLWGQGNGEPAGGTRIICTTVPAGIAFGERLVGQRGGVSGNFLVDGNNVAVQPLYVGMAVQRVFIGMESTHSAGDGLTIEAAQNCSFLNCPVSHSAGIGVVIDYSAAGNIFDHQEIDSAATWMAVIRQSGAAPPGLHDEPFDNHWYGGIFEREAATGGVWQAAGDGNGLHDVQVVHDEDDDTFTFVQVDEGLLTIDGGLYQANNGPQGTAFLIGASGLLAITGEPTVLGAELVFDNAGQIDLAGFLRTISCTTYLDGTPLNEKVSYGYAALGTIAVPVSPGVALAAAATPLAQSWWRLDPAHWPTAPAGRRLQCRFRVFAHTLDPGDGLVIQAVDVGNGGIGFGASVTNDADADGAVETATDWMGFPETAIYGYIHGHNDAAARGNAYSAHIDVRMA